MTGKTDWARLRQMSEDEIERNATSDPDAPLTDAEFWKDAQMVFPHTEGKTQVTILLDKDLLEFFKNGGRGYQSRINAALRSYYESTLKHT